MCMYERKYVKPKATKKKKKKSCFLQICITCGRLFTTTEICLFNCIDVIL